MAKEKSTKKTPQAESATQEEATIITSPSKRINWVAGIIASIVVLFVSTAYVNQRSTQEKAEYSYEAIQRLEKNCEVQKENTVSKENFVEYKEYQDDKLRKVEKDIDEIKVGQKEIQSDIKLLLQKVK